MLLGAAGGLGGAPLHPAAHRRRLSPQASHVVPFWPSHWLLRLCRNACSNSSSALGRLKPSVHHLPPGRPFAAAGRPQHLLAVAAQATRQQQPASSNGQAAFGSRGEADSSNNQARRCGRPTLISKDSEEDLAAAGQRLAAYLQQQGGISQAQAAQLAGKASAKLGAAADQLVPAPLQWFVGRGMRPLKAAQLVVHICTSSATHAFIIRQWPTWQPVFEANWQLADSCLAAYQQQCKATKERPLKSSESMAVMLSSQPSRHMLLLVRDLPSKVAVLQQGQLGLSAADVGQLVAAGAMLGGNPDTIASALDWLLCFAGSQEAAAGMLRASPTLLSLTQETLDSKVAALQAAWAGVLQPEQVRQLVVRLGHVLTNCRSDSFSLTAAVLISWFPQPSELYTVLQSAPQLLAATAATLQANERWFTGPPLRLSRQQFLERVRAAPQAFVMNFEVALMQRKLAFMTQVGAAVWAWAG